MKRFLITIILMLSATFSLVAQETTLFDIHVGGDVYSKELPTNPADLQKLVLSLAQYYNQLNDAYYGATSDNQQTIGVVIDNQKDVLKVIDDTKTKIDSTSNNVDKAANTVDATKTITDSVPPPKPKFMSIGVFCGATTDFATVLGTNLIFGPIVHLNLFDSVLLGIGGGLGFGSTIGLKGALLIEITVWAF
jgi:tetrahydromethanopterin S-methyltransferase subunit B